MTGAASVRAAPTNVSRAGEAVYPIVIYGPAAASAAVAVAAILSADVRWPPLWMLGLFTVLAFAGECVMVPLIRGGQQSFNAVVNFPAFILMGPVPAAVAAAVAFWISLAFVSHRSRIIRIFNSGQRAMSVLLAGYVWTILDPFRPASPVSGTIIPALLGAALVFAVNTTVLVSLSVSMRHHRPLRSVLLGNAFWQAGPHMALAAAGVVLLCLAAGRLPMTDRSVLVPAVIVGFIALLWAARRNADREFAVLHAAMADLARTREPGLVLDRLADTVERLSAPDMLWIARADAPPGDRIVLARRVPAGVLRSLAGGDGQTILDWTAERGAWCNDIADVPWGAEVERIFGRGTVRSLLAVPIASGGEVFGTLTIASRVLDYFLVAQVRRIEAFAGQAALALYNARLRDRAERSRARVAALEDVARMAAAGDDLAAIEQTIVTRSTALLGADQGILSRYDERTCLLTARAFHNLAAEDLGPWQTPVPVPGPGGSHSRLAASAQALATLGPVAVTGRRAAPAQSPADPPSGDLPPDALQSILSVPMVVQGRPIGTVAVARGTAHRWTTEEIDVLQTLANEGAMAMENARLWEETRRASTTDGLTGLLNHRACWDTIGREMQRARRYRLALSVVMIEVDGFKRYNDAYGHLRGDDVLRMVGHFVTAELRDEDAAARYGGDEFVLVLPNTDKAGATAVAERIRSTAASTPLVAGGGVTPVTVSLGVATYPEDGDTARALLDTADRRMYGAKRGGGNAVSLSAPAEPPEPGATKVREPGRDAD